MVALRNTDDASGASLRMSCSFSAMLEFALIRLETRTPAEAENQNFRKQYILKLQHASYKKLSSPI